MTSEMLKVFKGNVWDLPTKLSLSYLWCGGFMLSFFLVVQLVSGIILSFMYVADSAQSFSCVTEMGKGVLSGMIRYSHVWGVSLIFFLIFMHMGRSLYYSSYNKLGVWNVGFVLYILMMVEAFLGYVLPWHQMSYWAATVLTSMLKVIPVLGPMIYKVVAGGFSVTGVTLVRFFSLHVCLGFIMAGLSGLHLFYLHSSGSSTPLFKFWGYKDYVLFSPYFVAKDALAMSSVVVVFFLCMWLHPDGVLDVESFMEADPLVTPVSMKPEWYFLAFYAMLRSVSSKLGGLVMVMFFLVMVWLPVPSIASCYSEVRQFIWWCFCSCFVALSILGVCHPEVPYAEACLFYSVLAIVFITLYKTIWFVSSVSVVRESSFLRMSSLV